MTPSDPPPPSQGGADDPAFDHPKTVGPYRILEVLGEGGMGIVYSAEQTEPVRRRVAVKMMKLGMDSKEIIGRFQAERQALAVMEHPGIAKVLAAGVTESGRPYFVMELVKGIRIDEYCNRYRLTPAQRIELFISLCHAVQHAHQKGVIHRDLKPSNILVSEQDGKAVPKIIDFGIAKATGYRLSDATVITTLGQAVGTLAYMSPEQAEGSESDVDTRADIYSLGVILFQLLVGRVPVDPKEQGVPAFLAQLVSRDTSAPTLSERLPIGDADRVASNFATDPATLRRFLSGDIRWIVLKAMEKDRSRRYETANGLALDLQRYLGDEPVRARPPTAGYRMRKFARRNRAGVAAMVVAFAALGLGTTAATLGLVRARRAEAAARQAEARAQQEAETARQVSDFLAGIFEVNNPGEARGNSITAREILDRGALQVERRLGDQPVVQARLMATMGEVYRKLGLYGEAEQLLHESLDVRERALDDTDPEVAEALYYLGLLHSTRGNYEEAEASLLRARGILEADPQADGQRRADVLTVLGESYINRGRLDDAEPLLMEALDEHTRLRGEDAPEVATVLQDLGGLNLYRGELEVAEDYILRSLDIRERGLGLDHPFAAAAFNNLGVLYWNQERYPEALEAYQRALDIWEATLEPDHPRIGSVLNNIAETYWIMDRLDEAELLFLRALTLKEQALAPGNPSIAATLAGLANVYRDQGRHADAEPLYRRAIRILESSVGATHARLVAPLEDLARSLRAAGRSEEADRTEARARMIQERASG